MGLEVGLEMGELKGQKRLELVDKQGHTRR